ncbi:poly-gamma-glutamate hydrolase family protein [Staphylococcus sp. GSSP0090]|nr:poly-gamma-glutamate hydrolase family protein [Staphylococcus sp. GSSP0090]
MKMNEGSRLFVNKKALMGMVTTVVSIGMIALVSGQAQASSTTTKSKTTLTTTKQVPTITQKSTTTKVIKPVTIKSTTTIKKQPTTAKSIKTTVPTTSKSIPAKTSTSKTVASVTPTKKPSTPVKTSMTPAKSSNTPTKTSTTSVKKPSTPVKAPTASVKKPSTPVKAPTTAVKQPSTPVKAPTTAVKQPSTPSKTQTTLVKQPSTPAKAPTTAVKKPSTPAKAPTTTVKQPNTPTQTPTTAVNTPSTSTNVPLTPIAVPVKLTETGTSASSTAQDTKTEAVDTVVGNADTSLDIPVETRKSDYYSSMTELYNDTKEGVDWKKDTRDTGKSVLIVAPHGGNIEQGTTELTKLVANNGNFDYFSFEAIRPSNNTQLHVTSTHYDDATLHDMIQDRSATISIHGAQGDEQIVYLGGLKSSLRDAIQSQLEGKGFNVKVPPEYIGGANSNNFINKIEGSTGIQLELTTALRKAFFKDGNSNTAARKNIDNWTSTMYDFAQALNAAIDEIYNVK